MDAARCVQNEAVRSHCPADFARGEKSAEDGRRYCEKYHCGHATRLNSLCQLIDARQARLASHQRREKNLEPGNLGDVPSKAQSAKRKAQKFFKSKNSFNQRVALSGSESEKRSDSRRHFTGIGVVIPKILAFIKQIYLF
jgi:hypothetical protein